MKNTWVVFLLAIILLTMVRPVSAQQPAKIPKIGFLNAGFAASATNLQELVRELRSLGYIEGRNITLISRFAETKYDKLPALADELVRLNVDVIVTPGSNDTRAAKNATKTIPIVFLGAVSDPVSLGLVDSLARPGGNLTGFTTVGSVLAGKRLELMKETIPKLTRVAVLWNPENTGSAEVWKESQRPAQELGLQLHSMAANSVDRFESVFKEAIAARNGALTVTGGALIANNIKQVVRLAAKNRLPAIYNRAIDIADGGLMSYGPDEGERYRRAALMVDKILRGAKPGDIPVEQPTKYDLVINLKTAKALGLTIPPIVLTRATKVIK